MAKEKVFYSQEEYDPEKRRHSRKVSGNLRMISRNGRSYWVAADLNDDYGSHIIAGDFDEETTRELIRALHLPENERYNAEQLKGTRVGIYFTGVLSDRRARLGNLSRAKLVAVSVV